MITGNGGYQPRAIDGIEGVPKPPPGGTGSSRASEKRDDGGAAFPWVASEDWTERVQGMSLRDWFAGQALAGYFAAPNTQHRNAANGDVALYLYEMADAMLKERSRS